MRHRPVGLWAQGSAAVYMMRLFPFESEAVSSLVSAFSSRFASQLARHLVGWRSAKALTRPSSGRQRGKAVAICFIGLHAVERPLGLGWFGAEDRQARLAEFSVGGA